MAIKFTPKMIAQSQTRLYVKWKYPAKRQGYNEMIYWSFENERSITQQDIRYGYNKLLKQVEKLKGEFVVAQIYDCRTDRLLAEFGENV